MKQWKLIILSISVLIATSCESGPEKVVMESWSPNQVKLVAYYSEEDGNRIKVKEEKFYENGTREYFGSFDKDEQRHGEWRYYYDSGQLWSLGFYSNGKKEGKKEVFWPDGTMRYEGQFTDDEKSGTWTFYNPDGSTLQKLNFDTQNPE